MSEWRRMREREAAAGNVVLAERMREADLGIKRILVEQYATWAETDEGTAAMRTFDFSAPAIEDFESRS